MNRRRNYVDNILLVRKQTGEFIFAKRHTNIYISEKTLTSNTFGMCSHNYEKDIQKES